MAQDYSLGTGMYGFSSSSSDYLDFYATKSINSGFSNNSYSVDCHTYQNTSGIKTQTIPFALAGGRIGALASCSEVKKNTDRFSVGYCNSSIDCSKALTGIDTQSLLASISIPLYIAEDYVGISLGKEINKMDKIEAVRKFAEKKYGKDILGDCKSPFDYDSKNAEMKYNCDANIIDTGFNRMQDSCQSPRVSCFNNNGLDSKKDYKIFQSAYKKSNEDESVTQTYFKERSDTIVNDSLANDSEMLESLAGIIVSNDDNSAKLQNVFTKLSEFKKQGKLDPIFGYEKDYINSSRELFKKSVHYKYFEKLLQLKNFDLASAKKAIEEYRLTTAKTLLGKTCNETEHLSNICNSATKLKNSERISGLYNLNAATYLPNEKEDDRYDLLRGIYPQGVLDFDDFKIVMDAERCKAFNIVYVLNVPKTNPFGITLFNDWTVRDFGRSQNIDSVSNKPSSGNLILVDGKPNFNSNSDLSGEKLMGPPIPSIIKSSDAATEKINSSDESSLSSSISNGFKDGYKNSVKGISNVDTSSASSNALYNNSFNNIGRSYVENNDNTPKNTDGSLRDLKNTAPASSTNSALNDKISELSKKLASTEDNLERIKTEKEAADNEKERQKKISEENKTIADLKNQISDMKADSKTKADNTDSKDNGHSFASSGANGFKTAQIEATSSSGESHSSASVNKDQDISSVASNHAASSSAIESAASSSASRTPAAISGAISGSSSAKSGIVLTKIDGMTSEKASEAITERIIEMGGLPFYIEEGGVVKEIVPVIKNGKVILDEKGKPLFEKIVKGKVGDKKFARGKVQDKDGRAPASINDSADLKRDEEERLKHERAEYLKLKNITKKAFEKN